MKRHLRLPETQHEETQKQIDWAILSPKDI